MKYLLGLATGIVIGAAGAVAYSVATGKDLRELAKEVRANIEGADVSEIGRRIDAGMAEVEATVADRINEIRGVDEHAAADEAAPLDSPQAVSADAPEAAPA